MERRSFALYCLSEMNAVQTPQSIPCHLVAGSLGVGKTTAILHRLKRWADREFTAVLVNDFGPVGLDNAIIDGDLGQAGRDAVKTFMVPGGCICCSAAAGLFGAFDELAKLPRLDRIIIEPSGVVLVGDMLDLLKELRKKLPIDLRPVITLMDVRMLARPSFTRLHYFVRMIEAADILVANRCDLATPEQVQAFEQWAAGLYPPKLRVLTTDYGQLPDEVFDLRAEDAKFVPVKGLGFTIQQEAAREMRKEVAPVDHDHEQYHPGGVTWPAETRFHLDRLEAMLKRWATEGVEGMEGMEGMAIERLKGIFQTDSSWQLLEIACGDVHSRGTDYRRDNRMDWISRDKIDPEALRREIAAAQLG